MCGRYVSPEQADIERAWNLVRAPQPFARANYNVAPTHLVPALRQGGTGAPELVPLRWGLVPFWAKGVPPKYGTINATIERMREAPTYRGPWRRGQRAIVPAAGFYEWQHGAGGAKQPYYIRTGDQPVFGFAGLWDRSESGDGQVVESVVLITLPANDLMARIHNGRARMPAILAREDHAAWLVGRDDEAFAALKPYPEELMIADRVSLRVGSPKNNDAGLIEPLV
jgi:putative SOS response-associated peptidase YedK